MQKKSQNNKKHNKPNPYHICYDHYLNTPACTECTGLAYKPAENAEEWNSYQDIFDFTPEPASWEDNAQQ